MEKVQVFEHEQFGGIRVIYNDTSDDVWFIGKDLAERLGYQNGSRDINRHVDEEDKIMLSVFDGKQNRNTICINESGMYSLILRSNLPQAKEFKRWVTSEVLPSIRKHGAYMTDKTIDDLINNPDLLIGLAQALKDERSKREKAEKIIEEQEPKISYYNRVISSKGCFTATQVAKMFDISSAYKLNTILKELGVQYKQSGQWLLYSKYTGKGYTKTTSYVYRKSDSPEETNGVAKGTKWTEKGIKFIYDLLIKHNIIEEKNDIKMLS